MRTTLTIDEDVAEELSRLRDRRGWNLKEAVNHTLRAGLSRFEEERRTRSRKVRAYRIVPLDLGPCLVSLDDVSEALAVAEGDDFR